MSVLLSFAESAISYTKRVVRHGATNRLPDGGAVSKFSHIARVAVAMPWFAASRGYQTGFKSNPIFSGKVDREAELRSHMKRAQVFGFVNCMEQAATAFLYLYDSVVKSIYFMENRDSISGHAFVLLLSERIEESSLTIRDLQSGIICDPWSNLSFDLATTNLRCDEWMSKYGGIANITAKFH